MSSRAEMPLRRLLQHPARASARSGMWLAILCCASLARQAACQEAQTKPPTDTAVDETPSAPAQVDVEPRAADAEIQARLQRILDATEWFENPQVQVDEGIAFLSGATTQERYREWAGQLANNTQDVVAVVNRIRVETGSVWDLSPARRELQQMARDGVQAAPLIAVALILLVLTWLVSRGAVVIAGRLFERRIENRLLRQVATRAVAIPVFLLGLYLVLRISGLTQMAATVVGGTGLLGLIVGIAFRDIAENFLASILISMQRPFAIGDLVEVDEHQGFVQSVTTRGTVLMTFDGNHVQIPNATIYKAVIRNFTANPKMRLNFIVGIGYESSVVKAQQVALDVLRKHPVVLDEPESLVLVEELDAATVSLQVYFWINGHQHSPLKARSSVIRLVKAAFEKHEISMPDSAREVVFPRGVPLQTLDFERSSGRVEGLPPARQHPHSELEDGEVATAAEGNLSSEAAGLQQQARESRQPEEGTNLLEEPG